MIFPHRHETQSYAAHASERGQLLVLVLVFGSIFIVLITGLISSMIGQSQAVAVQVELQKASEIAEAGLNQYKWLLAVSPATTSIDGVTQVYEDPELGPVGEYTIDITSQMYCGEVSSIDVTSRANTLAKPNVVAELSATFRQPSVADYSFIYNNTMWYGSTRVITGPVHGNGGIRMQGIHNSTVASAIASFTCDNLTGCSPPTVVGGVYGGHPNPTPSLFEYPVANIDYSGITGNLNEMRAQAINAGIWYGPASPGSEGYQVVFQGDGTFDLYEVTSTVGYPAYSSYEGWHTERNVINGRSFVSNHAIDPLCPVLYFEDDVWLLGDITGKVSLAAADPNTSVPVNIVIDGSVDYVPGTNAGLLAIARTDVDLGMDVPDNMIANGIYVAQNGRFGRNQYCFNDCAWWVSGDQGLPSSLDPYNLRTSLTRLGTVVSNLRGGSAWQNGASTASGFESRVTSYDSDQVESPPPFTPVTNEAYEIYNWQQVR
jgi:hypothetical protein